MISILKANVEVDGVDKYESRTCSNVRKRYRRI